MKNIIFIIFSLTFLFSSLYLTNDWNKLGNILIYVFITSIVILPLLLKKKEITFNPLFLGIMYTFLLFCGISALINADYNLLIGSLLLLVLYIVSFIIVPMLGVNTNNLIFKTIIISHLPILIMPIIFDGFNTNPYRGIFYNPNSFGTIASTFFAVIFSSVLFNLELLIKGQRVKYIKIKLFIWVSSLAFVFYLVILSASRTSFISSVICLLVGFFYLSIHLIMKKKFLNFLIKGGIFSGIITLTFILLLRFTSLYEYLYFNIIYKFERKINEGDILANRGGIWDQTISEAGLFGKGNSYFDDNIGIGAHNTFISILGQYGWVPLIIFVLFLLICLRSTIKYALTNVPDKGKYLPLMLFFSFVTLSMGEGMLFKLSMIAMFFSSGATLKRKESLKKEVVLQKDNKSVQTRKKRKLVW